MHATFGVPSTFGPGLPRLAGHRDVDAITQRLLRVNTRDAGEECELQSRLEGLSLGMGEVPKVCSECLKRESIELEASKWKAGLEQQAMAFKAVEEAKRGDLERKLAQMERDQESALLEKEQEVTQWRQLAMESGAEYERLKKEYAAEMERVRAQTKEIVAEKERAVRTVDMLLAELKREDQKLRELSPPPVVDAQWAEWSPGQHVPVRHYSLTPTRGRSPVQLSPRSVTPRPRGSLWKQTQQLPESSAPPPKPVYRPSSPELPLTRPSHQLTFVYSHVKQEEFYDCHEL